MTIITRAFGVFDENATFTGLSDVIPSEWYYRFVASAIHAGIANERGMGDGTFGANLPMSREQMVTFTARAMIELKGYTELSNSEIEQQLTLFDDRAIISYWARQGVAMLVSEEILRGYVDEYGTTFQPQRNMTRAEVATVMNGVIH